MNTFTSSALFFMIIFLGCSSLKIRDIPENLSPLNSPYLTSQMNYQRNAVAPEELEPPLIPAWEESYISLPNRGFTVINDWLLFGTNNGNLIVANIENGSVKGKENLGDSCPVPPTVYHNILYLTFEAGKYGLIAYDVKTGDVLWRVRDNLSRSSPIVVENKVCFQTLMGKVLCFNYFTGEQIWSKTIPSHIRNSPAYSENLIITAALNGLVVAHEYTSGITIWEKNLEVPIMADPVIDGNNLYIATHSGSVFMLNLHFGQVIQQSDLRIPIYYSISVDESTVYVPLSNGNLIALDKINLRKKWSFQGKGPIADAPLVTQSYIYLTTLEKHLYIIEKLAGHVLQDIKIEGRARSTPIIKNNKLIIACENDRIIAYGKQN